MANIHEELNQLKGPSTGKTYGLDDDEFKEFSQKMRKLAEKQSART
jgi:hypothetical protein